MFFAGELLTSNFTDVTSESVDIKLMESEVKN